MNKFDVVIIGGGLGGLLCGNILSREGLSVCVLEKNNKLGGCIQSFSKNKAIFNTGLNYTESLGEGEVLYQYFKYFGIMDKIKIKRLDIEHFDKISFDNDKNEYPFAQGYDNFIESLSQHFPSEKQNLKKYIKDLEEVCNIFPMYMLNGSSEKSHESKLLNIGAFDYLDSITKNPKLREILGGMNSLYAGVKDKTPLYIHALINYSFIRSAWRFVDGSSQLAARIADVINENGGKIIRSTKVTKLGGANNEIEYAELENGEKIFAKTFISNLHPYNTLKITEPTLIKKAFHNRIKSLDNTIGMFSMYIVLKNKSFPYINYNHHHFSDVNVWTTRYNKKTWPEHYMLYTPAISKSDEWADSIIALTYMDFKEVEKWTDTYIEERGSEYLDFKQRKAELLLDKIEEKFPDIRKHIHCYYTSTPLTYRDYTGTPEGSSYGVLKDFSKPLTTIITAKSRISNLFFTGQNLNMHGILGVAISSALTCSEVVGYEYLINKIIKA
ncbi:MAG: NAD(P)/FAD-dependent oxidoreductase [Bacteroidetes bacterium]|nr:NAD(P)/FAD-dependent oxidoreductase [Bacteroidota bacterium]